MLRLHNTLSKQKEEFKPVHSGKVFMYSCGPTVYDYIHIGNLRAYISADVLRRYLTYLGYEVKHIKNITDVGHLTQDDIAQGDSGEDKIEKKAKAEKKTPEEISKFYEDYFYEAEKEMNILPAHKFPRATAYVKDMVKIIGNLIKKGHAYEKNGNVFFDVTTFSDYGKLSGNTLKQLKTGARLEEHPDKKNPWDFALWIKAPKDHVMKWKSPWSLGYPGWHIECSAMSNELLGDTIDIHTGGEDNIFPHHEAEIAQTECYTGKKFVNFWIHNRHLLVDGEKMSKSKGNFYILDDIKKKGYDPMVLRLLIVSSHYQKPLNFTWEAMGQSKSNLEKISAFYQRLLEYKKSEAEKSEKIDMKDFKKRFEEAMNDDLNTPEALAILFEFISETNRLMDSNKLGNPKEIRILFDKMNSVFGLKLAGSVKIPKNIKELAEKRQESREDKDFKKSDQLRGEIEKLGYTIEDTKEGYRVKKLKIQN